ncbi:hypothetical protein, partial [Parablautia sp. Marseille-Q6255]|uniref:hypothetical protein n=1 Tax=Parablautia sp. Marseille-Q6255 TaxID=3039593 RepID=UPI0024BCE89F
MITKKIKHKDNTGVVHEYDIGADAKNISEDTIHRFVSDKEKEEWSRKMDPAGNASESTVAFQQAERRENISTGEKLAGLFGKISRWFSDLKNHSFADLIQNATTADTTRAVSAAVAKNLQDQITQQNTNMLQSRGGWLSDLTVQASSNSVFKVSFTPFPRECIILIPIVRGGIQFPVWVNLLDNGSAEIAAISTNG